MMQFLKKKIRIITETRLFISILIFNFTWGQSAPGDIAFIAFNADGNDDFAFVTMVDISANMSIYFTDNEWNGSAFPSLGEGELTWTNGGSTLVAGSVVVFTDPQGGGSVNIGSVSGSGWNLGSTDEWIYALLSMPATSYPSAPTFLAAMANDAGTGWLTETGLTEGTHAIDFNNDHDGFKYTGDRAGQSSYSDYLAIVNNTSNWQDETSNGENILPISTTAFSLGVTISGDSGFRLMSSPVAGTIYSDLLSELWTQGMTGADETSGTANVWTLDVANQSWWLLAIFLRIRK